jgi:hypothetical protein
MHIDRAEQAPSQLWPSHAKAVATVIANAGVKGCGAVSVRGMVIF